MVWVFIGIYGSGIRSKRRHRGPTSPGGAATPLAAWARLVGASCLLSTSPEASRVLLGPEKNRQKLASCLDLPRY